ncbi:MAG: urease accessory protein UreF [Candidatus Aquicultorales bacterium]
MQLSDSSFPSGTFTQSFGLETYAQEGVVKTREALEELLAGYLSDSIATSDGLALRLAYRAARDGNLEELVELDRILTAVKLARESREGSIKTGVRLLRLGKKLYPDPLLIHFDELVMQAKTQGHYGVVMGMVGQSAEVGEEEILVAFAYSSAAAMVSRAVRLMPIGQNDGQLLLKRLSAVTKEASEKGAGLSKEHIGSITVAFEIRAMQHEGLYSRLFMS